MILRYSSSTSRQLLDRSRNFPGMFYWVRVTSGNERARDGLVGALSDLDASQLNAIITTPRPTGPKQSSGAADDGRKGKSRFVTRR
jgi:hypothetical protein